MKGRFTEGTIHQVSFSSNHADIGGTLFIKGIWEIEILGSKFMRTQHFVEALLQLNI